jgi:hypothetical protein
MIVPDSNLWVFGTLGTSPTAERLLDEITIEHVGVD